MSRPAVQVFLLFFFFFILLLLFSFVSLQSESTDLPVSIGLFNSQLFLKTVGFHDQVSSEQVKPVLIRAAT